MSHIPDLDSLIGYGLTTARILYRMPDHRAVLQTFVWQDYDVAPAFPSLSRFLAYWRAELDGPLHSVAISHHRLITPYELKVARAEFAFN